MLKVRCELGLQVGQFLEEARQLDQDHEQFLIVRSVLYHEALQGLVVLSYWVVLVLLQSLPVGGQLVFYLRHEHQREHLDV